MPMDRAGAIIRLLSRALAAGMFPGVAAAWNRQTTVLGSAAVRERLTSDHWFDLASLTKPLVTAPLASIAIREGALNLETRVGEVFSAADRAGMGSLTVHQLLTHSSGLPAWVPLYALAKGDPARALDCLFQIAPEAGPGREVVYSCVGFLVLGQLLAEVFGEPLDRAFDRLVSGPLGLTDELGFCPDPGTRSLVAGSARPSVEQRMLEESGFDPALVPALAIHRPDDGNARFLGGVAGNAGLFGTVAGVVALAREFLVPHSRLFSASEISHLTRNHTPGCGQARGLGWQLATTPGCSAGPGLGPSAFGHSGFTGTSVWVDPAAEQVLVLLANRHHPAHRGVDLHPLRRRFHALAMPRGFASPR